MILAEKIIKLRKEQGWSQEELAIKLGVSRQSVSKWESMTSMPDLDKIMKLSEIFSVSTDYLLKDNIDDKQQSDEETVSDVQKTHKVSLEEANTYMNLAAVCHRKIALAISMCIISPVALILITGAYEYGLLSIKENLANAIGTSILLIIIATSVAIFITYGMELEKYEYLEKEPIITEYGVAGIVQNKKASYEHIYRNGIVCGVTLCIISAIPLFISTAVQNEFFKICAVCILLTMIAIGVHILVRVISAWTTFQKLLEEGDYTRENKEETKNNAPITAFYWCFVTAIYLGISFFTKSWGATWIIWPVAGVLYAAIIALKNMLTKNKKC